MKKIGILGGTFDPPHIGHLIIAEEVKNTLNLDEIWFIPSQIPPHKQKALSEANDRVEMVDRAVASNDYFKVSTIEVERAGKSYTIDTVMQLKKENPDHAFHFIIGADMVEYLPKWVKIDELIKLVQFVGVQRKGYHLDSIYPIHKVDVPTIEISSTAIRKRLERGLSVKYQIPESVEYFIKEKHLYEQGRSY